VFSAAPSRLRRCGGCGSMCSCSLGVAALFITLNLDGAVLLLHARHETYDMRAWWSCSTHASASCRHLLIRTACLTRHLLMPHAS
jgi:hypothetical protein